jgi:hypothetical protein
VWRFASSGRHGIIHSKKKNGLEDFLFKAVSDRFRFRGNQNQGRL